MHPLLAREPALLQGAFQGAQPATPPPAEVFFGTTFATATPDTAAGGNLVSAGFTLRRSGDLTRVVTVSVKVAGAAPTPLVAADVQGGLSDVQYRFDPGVAALSLQVTFLAQDLDADHFGEVSLHDATGAAILGGVFDFALVHNHVVVVPPPGTYDLAPDWTQRWVMHTTALATIQQLALGVAAKAGALVTDDGSWVIVSKHVHSAPAAVGAAAGAAPLSGWAAADDLLPSGHPRRVDIRRASDIPASLAAGKQYVVVNNVDLGGRTFDIGGGGAPGNESYLRGSTAGRDRAAYPILSNGQLGLSTSSTLVRELALDRCPVFLLDGLSKTQIETNWFSGVDNGYGTGFINHDGNPSTVRDLLVAFNFFKARTGKISGCILRLNGPNTGQQQITVPRVARVRVFGNHYDELRIGPDNPVSGGNSGSSRYYFFGDNPFSDFCDSQILIDHNLHTNHRSAGPSAEFKMTGVRYEDNTVEAGDIEPFPWAPSKTGAFTEVRVRNSRVTQDPNAGVDAGKGVTIKRNLWIRRTSRDKAGNIALRDGFHEVTGNWGLILPPGVQPPAWASVTAAMGAGDLSIEINNGPLDWRTYPSGRVAGGGQEWENCGKLKIGANLATVRGGLSSGAAQPDLQSELCRIAPTTPVRDDRNWATQLSHMTGTDSSTPVLGASTLTIPHRMQAAENGFAGTPEVGCAGWDASYYGVPSVSRPGADDALWNVPLARWTVHPSSAVLVGRLWNDGFTTPGDVNLSTGGGIGIPRFETDGSRGNPAATTTIQVSYTDHGHADWSNMAEGATVPWNPAWRPSGGFWAGDANDDAELCVIDPATGEAWDLWQVELLAGKLQVGAAHKNVGDWRTTSVVAAGDAGSRGSGIPYVQMITLSSEVGAGLVPHAMAMPSRAEAVPAAAIPFVAPAQKTDGDPGLGAASNPGVPSGTRFGLVCTDADVAAWRAALPAALGATAIRALATIVQALRDYGWHVTDHAGSGHLQLGSDESEHWASLGLQTQTIAGKVYPRDALDGLLSQARLQAFTPPAPTGGDFDLSFSYTHRASPAATDAQGCASLLYCEMVGRGAYPADVSAWSPAQWGHAGDTEYQPNADWVRFTFNTLNTVSPALSAKLRLVVCAGGVITRPSPNEAAATWDPTVGVRYAMRCRKSGNDFRIWATDPRDGSVTTQSWTDATAGAMDHGNFLFRLQPGRWADIESFQLN